ncbi:membrane protein [Caballeronia jiangsuensis]|nr:membrane protein [Caballeronia jiangsuensis]
MPRNLLNIVVFSIGLAAVLGIGIAYIASNAIAFAVTLVIAGCYLAGAAELRRYQQITGSLEQAVAQLASAPRSFAVWLDSLHPSLRNAVRLRVEGERAALPGPVLAPYLVGLLVLLGMLGTLLGMVATLRGTGTALQSASDLTAIRASLSAPVTGLGFAFGTSIAGVATSAMLGLLSALCRRDRLHVTQQLDVKIATTLRAFTQAHQREETFKLLQLQTELMPKLVDRLQSMTIAIEQQSIAASERQIAGQDAFHAKAETSYRRLATSVELSLKQSVADSARAASAALQPVMQATMDGIAREVTALHGSVEHAVARQLEGLSSGFEASSAKVAEIWSESLSKHAQSSAALVGEMGASLDRFTQAFDQRATHLVEGVSAQMDRVSGGLESSVAKHEQSSDALVARMDASMAQFAQTFEARSTGLIDDVSARLETATGNMSQTWRDALEQHTRAGEQSAAQNQSALTAAAASFERHAASLVQSVDRSHADLRVELAQHVDERLATWSGALDTIASSLREQWQQTSAVAADRQKDICDALAQTARDMSAQSQAHASATIAEIERLVQAASEAPKAAAEVVAEMRQKLSDSMVRDTAMLDERSRLLATVETLLDAVNHASNEQRTAIDALVDTSATLLQRVGAQFTGTVETEAGKLGAMAAQVTASAVEMASLSDAFGAAVQSFGASNDKLVAHLERIETALDKSLARSDEQLAYYVAQAKEVIDLSMMSQKQIVEDLQHIAGQRVAGARAA